MGALAHTNTDIQPDRQTDTLNTLKRGEIGYNCEGFIS